LEQSRIEFSKDAFKNYRKLAANIKKKVDKVLLLLSKREKIDLKSIKGTVDTYRIRIGDYRILIKELKEDNVYLVFKIGPRGDIYKNL